MADDVMQMQRQAARRVQQMQEHTRRVFEEHHGRTPATLEAARTPGWWQQQDGPLHSPGLYTRREESATEKPAPVVSPTPAVVSAPNTAPMLQLPQLDSEQWLLLGLALLLFHSGCRTELMLALLYLAM